MTSATGKTICVPVLQTLGIAHGVFFRELSLDSLGLLLYFCIFYPLKFALFATAVTGALPRWRTDGTTVCAALDRWRTMLCARKAPCARTTPDIGTDIARPERASPLKKLTTWEYRHTVIFIFVYISKTAAGVGDRTRILASSLATEPLLRVTLVKCLNFLSRLFNATWRHI